MKLYRHLPLVVALILVVLGCTTAEQWRAFGASLEVGTAHSNGNWSLNKQGHREGDTQSDSYFFSGRPFAYWGMKMQAEMNARAMTEAAYAQFQAEQEPPPLQPEPAPVPTAPEHACRPSCCDPGGHR